MSGNAFAQVGKRLRSDPNFSLPCMAALAFGCVLFVDSVEQYSRRFREVDKKIMPLRACVRKLKSPPENFHRLEKEI